MFRQKQYIKDKITIASLKNISEDKILKWTESIGSDKRKKSYEYYIFIVVPQENTISFYRKSKKEKILK